MSRMQPRISSKSNSWSTNMRPRVGTTIGYLGFLYANVTGRNATPGLTADWVTIGFEVPGPLSSGAHVFNKLVTDVNDDSFMIVSGTYVSGDQDKLESYTPNTLTREL